MSQDVPVEKKAERALELGETYFDVDNGHVELTTNQAILSSLENPSEWFDGRWDWQSSQDGRFTVIEIVDAADQSCTA